MTGIAFSNILVSAEMWRIHHYDKHLSFDQANNNFTNLSAYLWWLDSTSGYYKSSARASFVCRLRHRVADCQVKKGMLYLQIWSSISPFFPFQCNRDRLGAVEISFLESAMAFSNLFQFYLTLTLTSTTSFLCLFIYIYANFPLHDIRALLFMPGP